MISERQFKIWEKEETARKSEAIQAFVGQHTPQTTQGASLLVSARTDGVIIHLVARDGEVHHLQLNAHLAALLAQDLKECGQVDGWMNEDLSIRVHPSD